MEVLEEKTTSYKTTCVCVGVGVLGSVILEPDWFQYDSGVTV